MDHSSIFVLVISLFIVIFIIISYFILSDSYFIDEKESSTTNSSLNTSHGNEVFHIRDNDFNYEEAKAVCEAHDAKLANIEQVINAYKKGANWCNYGWSDDQLALYPIQPDFWEKIQGNPQTKNQCGVIGVNGGHFDNTFHKFGANCYGKKPSPKDDEKSDTLLSSIQLNSHDKQKEIYSQLKNNIKIAPFNDDQWYQ